MQHGILFDCLEDDGSKAARLNPQLKQHFLEKKKFTHVKHLSLNQGLIIRYISCIIMGENMTKTGSKSYS